MVSGSDAPMSNLLISGIGALAEFEQALIREHQLKGNALTKRRAVHRGCQCSQGSDAQVQTFNHVLSEKSK
jgi:DNA invertase Pin-like site-specific DNA recombinase